MQSHFHFPKYIMISLFTRFRLPLKKVAVNVPTNSKSTLENFKTIYKSIIISIIITISNKNMTKKCSLSRLLWYHSRELWVEDIEAAVKIIAINAKVLFIELKSFCWISYTENQEELKWEVKKFNTKIRNETNKNTSRKL